MMATIVMNMIMGSVILLMLGAGLGIEIQQIIDFIKRIRLVGLGLLANFIIIPAVIYVFMRLIPLSPDIKIGIILMAAAPLAPMAPSPFVAKAKGDVVYSVGLMTICAVLSLVLTPLIISLFIPESVGGVVLNPLDIVRTVLIVQIIPVSVGMAIRRTRPGLAEKLLKVVPKIGQIGLLIGVALLLASQARGIAAIDPMAYLLMVVFVVISLLVGDMILKGESLEKRRSLAVSTAIRNVPLAFLIANSSYPGTVVAPVALIFSVFTMLLSIVYGRLRSGPQSVKA